MKKLLYYWIPAFFFLSCNNEKAEGNEQENITEQVNEQQFKNAIKKFPDSTSLKEKLIQYYVDKADYTSAINVMNEALARDSMNPDLWDSKAILHFENGDTISAIKSFEQAVKIFPRAEYMVPLGRLYAQTKNKLALAIADTLLGDKRKADKEAYYIKGLYYASVNDKTNAISFFNKCIAMNYTFMEAYREKAIALYDMEKYTEALVVLDKALTLQNNFDEGYYYSGKCLEKLNRIPEAIQSYQNALQLDPDYEEAKDALKKLENASH